MSSECVITLDNPDCVYDSGETLIGSVKLQIEKVKSIRGILIRIIGYGKFSWGSYKTRKKSSEQYLNTHEYVVGSADTVPFDLQTGTYNYTFKCQLPIQLPTSVDGEDYDNKKYKIKYKVIVTIHRPYIFDNVFKKDFIVNHVLDFNLFPHFDRRSKRNESVLKIEPSIFSLCCHDNVDIKAILEIPTDGFIPGQQIPYTLFICNDSNDNIDKANIKLLKYYILQSSVPIIAETEIKLAIRSKVFDEIPGHTNKEIKDFFLVPNVPPSQATKRFRLGYKIRVKMCVGYVKKFYVEVPVTIGTIETNLNPNPPIVISPPNTLNSNDNCKSISSIFNETLNFFTKKTNSSKPLYIF